MLRFSVVMLQMQVGGAEPQKKLPTLQDSAH
jgi:hypothetical protein